jgi:hypothetical protein
MQERLHRRRDCLVFFHAYFLSMIENVVLGKLVLLPSRKKHREDLPKITDLSIDIFVGFHRPEKHPGMILFICNHSPHFHIDDHNPYRMPGGIIF